MCWNALCWVILSLPQFRSMEGFPMVAAVPLFAGGFKSRSAPGFSVGFRVSICPVLECSVVPSVSVCWVRWCKSSLRTTFLGRRLAAACSNLLCAVMLCGAFGSDVLGTLLQIFTLCFKSSLWWALRPQSLQSFSPQSGGQCNSRAPATWVATCMWWLQ